MLGYWLTEVNVGMNVSSKRFLLSPPSPLLYHFCHASQVVASMDLEGVAAIEPDCWKGRFAIWRVFSLLSFFRAAKSCVDFPPSVRLPSRDCLEGAAGIFSAWPSEVSSHTGYLFALLQARYFFNIPIQGNWLEDLRSSSFTLIHGNIT